MSVTHPAGGVETMTSFREGLLEIRGFGYGADRMQPPSPQKAPLPPTEVGSRRPTAWWLAMLRRRAERMYEEKLKLDEPIQWTSEEERLAAIAFFNAAFRAEESGLTQAHA